MHGPTLLHPRSRTPPRGALRALLKCRACACAGQSDVISPARSAGRCTATAPDRGDRERDRQREAMPGTARRAAAARHVEIVFEAVAVDVAIAGVADAVAVLVGLIAVGGGGAVVARVEHTVA